MLGAEAGADSNIDVGRYAHSTSVHDPCDGNQSASNRTKQEDRKNQSEFHYPTSDMI